MAGTVGIDVGGTYTDLYFSGDDGRVDASSRCRRRRSDPSIGLLDALHAAGSSRAMLDADPARHHDRHQRGDRAARRALRADHHARFSRRARTRPPRPAAHVWPDRHPAPADPARLPLGGRRTARPSAARADAARRGRACASWPRALAGRERRRRRGLASALLRQPGARGARPRHPARGQPGLGGRDLERRHARILRVRAHQHGGRAGLSAAAGRRATPRNLSAKLADWGFDRDADHAVERRRRAASPAGRARGPHRALRARRPA